MVSKAVQLFERARHSKNPEVVAFAARVRQLFETAERRYGHQWSSKTGLTCRQLAGN